MNDPYESRMLVQLFGAIFALATVLLAVSGIFGMPLLVSGAICVLFFASLWLTPTIRLGLLTLVWPLLIAAFAWSVSGESFGLMEGGAVFLFIFLFLACGFVLCGVLFGRSLFGR